MSDDYFPQENLDLTQPEIKTFLYYYVTQDHGEFYKKYTEEQIKIKEIPSRKSAINFFDLIKCSDTVKIDEKLVIDGHNEKPVLKINGISFMITSRTIPPPTAVMNDNARIPVRLKWCSIAIKAPVILNETSPMLSLKINSGLFSIDCFL